MRLYELIDFDAKQSRQTADSYKTKVRNTGAQHMGAGAFATAYQTDSPKRQNQVTKVGRTGEIGANKSTAKTIEEDGFLVYLKTTRGKDNPYYPTLYDLRVIKEPVSGALSYRANMHKLSAFRSDKIFGNTDLMTSLYDDMFYGREYGYFSHDEPGESILRTLDTSSRMPEIIKDPELKEAMATIVKLRQEGNFQLDLHGGNVMWRITGTRPQFIIYDPLA